MKKKKPTTLKGWQKLYPDAIKIQCDYSSFLNDRSLIGLVFGKDAKAKVLQNTSTGTWSSKNGSRVVNRAIVSKLAAQENKLINE